MIVFPCLSSPNMTSSIFSGVFFSLNVSEHNQISNCKLSKHNKLGLRRPKLVHACSCFPLFRENVIVIMQTNCLFCVIKFSSVIVFVFGNQILNGAH